MLQIAAQLGKTCGWSDMQALKAIADRHAHHPGQPHKAASMLLLDVLASPLAPQLAAPLALVLTATFLRVNRLEWDISETDAVLLVENARNGALGLDQIARFIDTRLQDARLAQAS
ncbi:MAG: hypothetical protein JJU26_13105 [Oceanicaulis sp.]|uniref:hypothetical protein n=1 Tax=Glycocaulis sp. TaxID=1969725 RepID=UPI0025C654EF|nr:hypothetical protein [Glycocaulis sp.]MCC5982644.1 hypothetical protein [Oceanicaulis sp.]MCH8522353.1 hypothetical protein [Glycocaulis sp.]